jgi:tRNA dimethylallyltransferase
MTIGTGKDYDDYIIDKVTIPYHLVDIVDAGYKYNVFEFQQDFLNVYNDLRHRHKVPILCGGSGMYIESVTKGYRLIQVPLNEPLRKKLDKQSMEELTALLSTFKILHNTTDIINRKRITRAIEIEVFYRDHPEINHNFPSIKPFYIGVKYDRQSQRMRITQRLSQRLNEGMIDEVENLLTSLPTESITYYGLEYKHITLYLRNKISYDEMFSKLETAIHQFAKRQMTWFRKMERNGINIHWLDGHLSIENKVIRALELLNP